MNLKFAAILAVTGTGLVSAMPVPEQLDNETPFAHLRFGHGIHARGAQLDVLNLERGAAVAPVVYKFVLGGPETMERKLPCPGARFRQKSIEMSNTFRQALGMPLIKMEGIQMMHTSHGAMPIHGHGHQYPPHGPGFDRIHNHGRRNNFFMRLHFALMALGPWEGRAIAFVLGCGIGVLLRMFWVLIVVSYRAIKGSDRDSDEDGEGYLRLHAEVLDAEEIFVAPPQYYLDEKVVPVIEDKAVEDKN